MKSKEAVDSSGSFPRGVSQPELPAQPEQLSRRILVYSSTPQSSEDPTMVFRHQLNDRIKSSELLVKPKRSGYFIGEDVEAEVRALDGNDLGKERFNIEASPGSGFAGQVYRAMPERGVICDASQKDEGKESVAIKVLRPKSRWKEAFRDLLFKLSYQTSFAPRLREEALRSALIWQELFRVATNIEFGTNSAVAKPFGYYWDTEVESFAGVHEWVNGRDSRYEVDDKMVLRWLGKTNEHPDSEMRRKRVFMDDLVGVCHDIGALGLAQQYEWYTLVSQANVLTRNDKRDGFSEFIAVDCQPGLAVPFFLPLSLVHARIIFDGLRRGVFAHFDEVDFKKLDSYLAMHAESFSSVDGLIQRLKEDDERYRTGLPNLWHIRTRILRDRELRGKVKEAIINDWQKLGKVSEDEGIKLKEGSKRYLPYLILDNVPVLGQPLMRLWGNERYRQHLANTLRNSDYLRELVEVGKAHDLLGWEGQRVTTERAIALASSTPRYLSDKLLLSWQPKGFHRLATDSEARTELVRKLITQPVRLVVDRKYREEWFDNIVNSQLERGIVTPEQAEELIKQVGEKRMQGFIRDLGFTVGTEAASKALYLVLAAYGLSTKDFLPLGIAALNPISPSGILREAYVLAQLASEIPHIIKDRDSKLLFSRGLGAALAPWRAIGNFFVPLEMFTYYNDMSLLLEYYYVSKMIDAVPVFGGEGKLLEYWTFNIVYNLPLSVKRAVLDSKSPSSVS